MGFSGRDQCKSYLPLIWCFSANGSQMQNFQLVFLKYHPGAPQGIPQTPAHLDRQFMKYPELQRRLSIIEWHSQEVGKYTCFWVQTRILQSLLHRGTHWCQCILMAHQWGTWTWPYGVEAGFKPVPLSSPISWAQRTGESILLGQNGQIQRDKCWRLWKKIDLCLAALKAALLTWGLAAFI